MTQAFRVSLRAGEKIYINGAVLRVDRKVTLELMNDVTFLMENHVLQPDEAVTPLRQLYFVVQTLLMEPDGQQAKLQLFREFYEAQCGVLDNPDMLAHLEEVGQIVEDGRYFEALRTMRRLFPVEDEILMGSVNSPEPNLEPSPEPVPQIQRSSKDGSYAA